MSLFTITVNPREAVIVTRRGAVQCVLTSGRHRRTWGARYTRLDLRESLLQVSPQEILTQDGIQVRVSATVRWSIVDPVAFVQRTIDPLGSVYLAAQVALRDALGELSAADLGRRGGGMPSGSLTAAVAEVAREVSVEVAEVVVRDVILPTELRSAMLEFATARQRGAAQLEMARAETAALRSLANGAKLLDDHPALARIRLLQAAPMGTRVVLSLGADALSDPVAD